MPSPLDEVRGVRGSSHISQTKVMEFAGGQTDSLAFAAVADTVADIFARWATPPFNWLEKSGFPSNLLRSRVRLNRIADSHHREVSES